MRVGDVGIDGETVHLGGDAEQGFGAVDVIGCYPHTVVVKSLGDGSADALLRAGYQRYPPPAAFSPPSHDLALVRWGFMTWPVQKVPSPPR